MNRNRAVVIAGVSFAAVLGGVAYAVIPGAGGVINGCYNLKSGVLRVIDDAAPAAWKRGGCRGTSKGPRGR